MSDAVDPDDVRTWPPSLRHTLAECVADVDPAETYACDLEGLTMSDEQVTALLGGRPLRAYHATRLLPHEVESVRRDGLRALSPEHVEQRIAGALGSSAITTEEADRLRAGTVYAEGAEDGRADQVCAVLGRIAFGENWQGVSRLLSCWGGEAIYWHANGDTLTMLKSLGSPSIVVLDLPLTAAPWLMFPGLGKSLAGHLGGLLSCGADVIYKADVPASAIVGIWQPGAPEYDRFTNLPTA